MGAGFFFYRAASWALAPAIPLFLSARAARGKEDAARIAERYGVASLARPEGKLVWIHAVSVGECQAALPLIAGVLKDKSLHILLTSGTVTAAALMAERLPERALHQYIPVDTPLAVARFLDHWRPDLGIFIDSELWPNLITGAHARAIPLVLANARLSEKSYRGWMRMKGFAAELLAAFSNCLAQDDAIAARLKTLGAKHVSTIGSLKADAPALPVDKEKLAELQRAIGARPILLAASTHPGEDDQILIAAAQVRSTLPELLTIIAPRHPERGADIAALGETVGFTTARRSQGALPGEKTALYVADTLGELGLFFRAAHFAYLGGSLVPHGGQNPLEPAILGRAVLAGPYTDNFAAIYEALFAAQGTGRVAHSAALATQVLALLQDSKNAAHLGAKAKEEAERLGGALDRTLKIVQDLLDARS